MTLDSLSVESVALSEQAAADADEERDRVVALWRTADADNVRTAAVMRSTFDQLYDGRHTGRFRWDQLYKTEKTHFGTLIEINLRREFADVITDGRVMDYQIGGIEIDCKYSQSDGGWMIPPEALNHLLLVCTASDADGVWSVGVVRATADHLRTSHNRDHKTGLNLDGRSAIVWLARNAALAPNVLLSLPQDIIDRIFAPAGGQARVNELLRLVTNRRIGRNTIATVAQQDDYMKRVRANGGARTTLAAEGLLIPGGDYERHRQVARDLGAEVPVPGEVVSVPVVRARPDEPDTTYLDGCHWRMAHPGEARTARAPMLPDTRRKSQ